MHINSHADTPESTLESSNRVEAKTWTSGYLLAHGRNHGPVDHQSCGSGERFHVRSYLVLDLGYNRTNRWFVIAYPPEIILSNHKIVIAIIVACLASFRALFSHQRESSQPKCNSEASRFRSTRSRKSNAACTLPDNAHSSAFVVANDGSQRGSLIKNYILLPDRVHVRHQISVIADSKEQYGMV